MPHDVFISYSSHDKAAADAVCHRMEAAGIRCWIAPRDVGVGTEWDDAVIGAVSSAKIVVLVFSAAANNSRNVRNEIVAAADANAIIFPFRIENVFPSGGLQLHLSRVHWLDAMTPPMEAHIDQLVESAKRVLDPSGMSSGIVSEGPAASTQSRRPLPGMRRGWAIVGLVLGGIALLAIVVLVIAVVGNRPGPPPAVPFSPPSQSPALAPAVPAPSSPAPVAAPVAPIRPPSAGFIVPDSDKRELTQQDLAGLTCRQLDIARNEIYARRGRYFNREDLKLYFSRFDWYKPHTFDPPLNTIEQINVPTIIQAERDKGCGHS